MGTMAEAETVPEKPADLPLTIDNVMASPAHRDLSTPKLAVADPAFPFTLPLLEGHRQIGELVSLGDFAGKRPVALIFGSYT
jgi:hypothetical protein